MALHIISYIYITAKTFGCFNHPVVVSVSMNMLIETEITTEGFTVYFFAVQIYIFSYTHLSPSIEAVTIHSKSHTDVVVAKVTVAALWRLVSIGSKKSWIETRPISGVVDSTAIKLCVCVCNNSLYHCIMV